MSYRAALHRQEKTRQYASLRLLAYRESLFVQDHMVTDDGPVERLFDDTPLLALHCITASRVTGRSSAALPDIPAPSGEGLASWKLGFADRAQVLAPDWPRREIKKTVYAMARLYHTPRKPADTAGSGDSPAAACSLRLRE